MSKKWDVFIYGDINMDIIIPGIGEFPLPGQEKVVDEMDTCIGGGAALTAMGLGRLGINTVFRSRVGNDCYGNFIREELIKNKIDCSLLEVSKVNKTGISLSFTNEKDRCFLTARGTNLELNLKEITRGDIRNTAHIHMTGYDGRKNHGQYGQTLKMIHEEGGTTVSFDVGWDDTGEWYAGVLELIPYIDVLFMNETEVLHYTRQETVEEAMEVIRSKCRIAVIKMGGKGAAAITKDSTCMVDSFPVKAVDTTGAGDSFNAGFIYGFLKRASMKQCLQYANACGALSVTAYGGNTAFPEETKLMEFLKE